MCSCSCSSPQRRLEGRAAALLTMAGWPFFRLRPAQPTPDIMLAQGHTAALLRTCEVVIVQRQHLQRAGEVKLIRDARYVPLELRQRTRRVLMDRKRGAAHWACSQGSMHSRARPCRAGGQPSSLHAPHLIVMQAQRAQRSRQRPGRDAGRDIIAADVEQGGVDRELPALRWDGACDSHGCQGSAAAGTAGATLTILTVHRVLTGSRVQAGQLAHQYLLLMLLPCP